MASRNIYSTGVFCWSKVFSLEVTVCRSQACLWIVAIHALAPDPHRCMFSQMTEGCRDGNIFFFFCLCLGAFVCDIAPHANLQIIEGQGNNSRRLFCPLTTCAGGCWCCDSVESCFGCDTNKMSGENAVWKLPSRIGWSAWTSGQSGSCGRLGTKTHWV